MLRWQLPRPGRRAWNVSSVKSVVAASMAGHGISSSRYLVTGPASASELDFNDMIRGGEKLRQGSLIRAISGYRKRPYERRLIATNTESWKRSDRREADPIFRMILAPAHANCGIPYTEWHLITDRGSEPGAENLSPNPDNSILDECRPVSLRRS